MFSSYEKEGSRGFSLISQFASEVIDYSSSYGSQNSISYSVQNILSRPAKFPQYGDFAESFSMRKFNQFLDNETEFSLVNKPSIYFHDFVTLKFESYVTPHEVKIYETYNPGSVIRILAYCESSSKWILLWESLPTPVERHSREFSPPIKMTKSCTRILRIEFNHSQIDYYTGIDGVCLVGSTRDLPKKDGRGLIQKKLENFIVPANLPSKSIEEFLKSDLTKFIENDAMSSLSVANRSNSSLLESENQKENFELLPYETIFEIFKFLDLQTLYRCSEVCQLFKRVTLDPLLYVEVNLKFYWFIANSTLLNSLTRRSNLVRKIDLSSCGFANSITSADFENFINSRGKTVTALRLNSSYFLKTSCLEAISTKCGNLTELSLRNYSNMTDLNFQSLSVLTKLEVLDLSRSGIDQEQLTDILRNNKNLQKLNLAFPSPQVVMDDICVTISTFNKNLRSINLWKSSHFSNVGLRALANCTHLQEVDLGWCIKEEVNVSESLTELLQNCKDLKKLVLSAIRSISESDLEEISNCVKLEQLDLLGVVGVSSEMCFRILERCQNLNLLDISFCVNIDEENVTALRNSYPNVSIKKSVVPED